MADKNHTDARHTFTHHGFMTRSDPTSRHVEEPARSDFLVTSSGKSVCVEVKHDWNSFSFDKWPAHQREWAFQYCMNPPFSTPYWLYIGVDVKPTGYKRSIGRRTWLIDALTWVSVEQRVESLAGQRTLPLTLTKHHTHAMRDNGLSMDIVLKPFELTPFNKGTLKRPQWHGDLAGKPWGERVFVVPKGHPFEVLFPIPNPS